MTERSLTAKAAYSAWRKAIKSHGLTPVHKISQFNTHKTPLCFLKKGPHTVRGAGKGKSVLHNKLSANYEALEFYLSGINYNAYPVILLNQTDMAKKAKIFPYRCCPELFLSEKNGHKKLPWVIYSDIQNQDKYAVPLMSVDLSYMAKKHAEDELDYPQFDFYSASNGLASGSTYEDAVIHAVLEVVERDAHSYFFLDSFLLNKKIKLINHNSLPKILLKSIKKIEQDFSNKLIIFKIPSRFDVPVYGAAFLDCPFEASPRGAGASLNPEIAVERAVYEAAQSYNLVHNDYLERNFDKSKMFKHKFVKYSAGFPIKKLIKHKKVEYEDFESSHFEINNAQNYLKTLTDKVYKYSKILLHVPYQDEKVVCVRAIVPEAEEFFLICHGLKLMPNTTTQKYIKQQSGKIFSWDNLNLK